MTWTVSWLPSKKEQLEAQEVAWSRHTSWKRSCEHSTSGLWRVINPLLMTQPRSLIKLRPSSSKCNSNFNKSNESQPLSSRKRIGMKRSYKDSVLITLSSSTTSTSLTSPSMKNRASLRTCALRQEMTRGNSRLNSVKRRKRPMCSSLRSKSSKVSTSSWTSSVKWSWRLKKMPVVSTPQFRRRTCRRLNSDRKSLRVKSIRSQESGRRSFWRFVRNLSALSTRMSSRSSKLVLPSWARSFPTNSEKLIKFQTKKSVLKTLWTRQWTSRSTWRIRLKRSTGWTYATEKLLKIRSLCMMNSWRLFRC